MAIIASADQDPETGSKPKRGGKLNRSETATVRLDPRLNYLSELAARALRRTKSSFIEWAVEQALRQVPVPGTGNWDKDDKKVEDLAFTLWSVDEAERLVALAYHAPILMTHEEQLMWKVIRGYALLWRGRYETTSTWEERQDWCWDPLEHNLIIDRLQEHFEEIRKVALGDENVSSLSMYKISRKTPEFVKNGGLDMSSTIDEPASGDGSNYDDLDDDIPF